MKCPNCYNDNEEGRTTCKYCGATLPQTENVENINLENNENTNVNVNINEENVVDTPSSETVGETVTQTVEKPKKEKKKMSKKTKRILIILLVLVIICGILAFLAYYYMKETTPDKIYNKAIDYAMNEVFDNGKVDATSGEINAKVKFTVPDSNELSVLNDYTLDTTLGFDAKTESGILKFKLDKENTTYIDATLLADLDHRLAYIGETSIFDKYIRLDIPEDFVAQIEDTIDFDALAIRDTTIQRSNIKTALHKEINNNINQGTFGRDKANITYNGKNKSVRDDIYTLTEGGAKVFFTNVLTSLKNDSQFMSSFEESEWLDSTIDDMLDEIKYLKDDDLVETPNYAKVHLYTNGLKFDFMGIMVEYVSETDGIVTRASITKSSETGYIVLYENVNGEDEERVEVDLDIVKDEETGTTKVTSTTKQNEEEYKVELEYSYTINEGISSIDMSNVKKQDELTEEDMEKMKENITKLPLYELIEGAIEYVIENGVDFELGSGIDAQTQLPSYIELKENESYLITSDAKVLVFEVPAAFESNYNGNLYKSYRKNNRIGDRAEVYLNLVSGNDIEEILDEYKESYDFLFEKEYETKVDEDGNEYQVEVESKYKDIYISEYGEENIGGVTYHTLEVSYNSDTKNKIKYYVTDFNDDYCYVLRIEDESGIVTESELNKVLQVTKYVD